jgi:hypothetical protein
MRQNYINRDPFIQDMNFVVIGTAHEFQTREPGLEAILNALAKERYPESPTAVAEEWSEELGYTSAQRVAKEHNLRWRNMDMTAEQRQLAGIFHDQRNRASQSCRVASDNVREEFWVEQLDCEAPGTTFVVCGYLHFESLVQKLHAKGHPVDKRIYLETVPAILIQEPKESGPA